MTIPGLSTRLVQRDGKVYLTLTIDPEACLNGINAATRDRLAREQKRHQYARRNGA